MRLVFLALLGLACQAPTAPDYWRTATVCRMTVGQAAPLDCHVERCHFFDGAYHCP